jgi:hypothetical protein
MKIRGAVLAVVFYALLSCSYRIPLPKDANWDAESATFSWSGGDVKVPVGFTYQVDQGTDTFEGHFTSPDRALIVYHDIGGYAGAYASHKRAFTFEERVVDGARVWTAKREWPDGEGGHTVLVAVTFPDSGCANFFLMSSNPKNAAPVEFIANNFRPKIRSNPGILCQADR